jgi:hypothetical protein
MRHLLHPGFSPRGVFQRAYLVEDDKESVVQQIVERTLVGDVVTALVPQPVIHRGIELPEGLAVSTLTLLYNLLHALLSHLLLLI